MPFSGVISLLDIALFLVVGIIADKISNRNQKFPRLILLILGGFLLTQLGHLTALGEYLSGVESKEFIEFIAELALGLVLFREGLELNLGSFIRNIKPVLILAFIGLIITTLIFASIISLITPFSFLLALLVAGILAPTDPAATFSIFKGGLRINPKEKEIMGSESALNDAVAIVLVTTVFIVSAMNETFTFDINVIIAISTSFFGGILLGLILGLLFMRINSRLDHHAQTNYISLGLVLLSFTISILLHGTIEISAAITSLTAGAVFANPDLFGYPRFSVKHLHEFQSNISELGEILAFSLLGILISLDNILMAILVGFAFAVVIILSRLITIAGLLRKPANLTLNESIFISWGGMRGLATGVLAIMAFIEIEKSESLAVDASFFLNAILIGLIFTALIQGLSLKYVGQKTSSIRISDKRSEFRAERRIITSKLAYYRKKLESNDIFIAEYDAITLPLRDQLAHVVSQIELEKKSEREQIDIYIKEFEMVIAVLQDAIAYKEILLKNKREVFYLEEQIAEYEDRERKSMEDILVKLDIILLKKQAAEQTKDAELINEADELIDFAKDRICNIRDKYPAYASTKLYEKICNLLGEENLDQEIVVEDIN